MAPPIEAPLSPVIVITELIFETVILLMSTVVNDETTFVKLVICGVPSVVFLLVSAIKSASVVICADPVASFTAPPTTAFCARALVEPTENAEKFCGFVTLVELFTESAAGVFTIAPEMGSNNAREIVLS